MNNIKEDEVYFLGKQTEAKHHHKIRIWIIASCIIALFAVCCYWAISSQQSLDKDTAKGQMLDVVNVLPKGSYAPRFEGKYNMMDFCKWVAENLKYPKGYETIDAKVVVSLVVQKDGTLGKFKIISAPKNKIFEKTVIALLKSCPKWKPAKLADGSSVDVEYTLPVTFRRTRTE